MLLKCKHLFIKYIKNHTQEDKTRAVFIFRNASFSKRLPLFLELVPTRQNCVYFARQVKADPWSTHRVWEDVFVCTITAALFIFPRFRHKLLRAFRTRRCNLLNWNSLCLFPLNPPLTGFCSIAGSNSFIISLCWVTAYSASNGWQWLSAQSCSPLRLPARL